MTGGFAGGELGVQQFVEKGDIKFSDSGVGCPPPFPRPPRPPGASLPPVIMHETASRVLCMCMGHAASPRAVVAADSPMCGALGWEHSIISEMCCVS